MTIFYITAGVFILLSLRVAYRQGYKKGYERGISAIESLQKTAAPLAKAKMLSDHLYTLGKFDILFSSDIVMFLMTKIPSYAYNEFFTDTLAALKGIEHTLPKTIKTVVLRSVKVSTKDSSKEYMFEPLFMMDSKELNDEDVNDTRS